MAQVKISELPEMEELDGADVLASVDVSEKETKKTPINKILEYVNKNTDYTKIKNKPQINSVELTGNVSLDTLGIVDKKTAAENLPKNEIEGTENVFDDGLESPLFALGGDGKSEQVTTTGKNKLGFNNLTVNNSNTKGLNLIFSEDGTLTINGTITDSNINYWNIPNVSKPLPYTPNTNYVFSVKYISGNASIDGLRVEFAIRGGNNETDTRTYQLTKNLGINSSNNYTNSNVKVTPTEDGFITGFQVMGNVGATFNNLKLQFWYNEGEKADEFEPYTGGQPSPSPDYEQPINSIEGSLEFSEKGNNVLPYPYTEGNKTTNGINFTINNDKSITVSGTANIDANLLIFGTDTVDSGKPLLGSYISGGSENVNIRVINRSSDGYHLLAENTNGFTKIDKSVYTTGYIELRVRQGKVVNEIIYPMLIEPNEVTFSLGEEKLRSIEDVKDELVVDLDTGNYYKLKNIEHLELAIANMNSVSEDYPGWLNVPNIQDYFPNANATINTLAKFKSNITTDGLAIGINTLGQSNLWLEKGQFNLTQTQWKEQYPDLVFKLDYSILSTETIKLGTLSAEDLVKLKTFKGYNNVTVNTNLGLMNIRLTYGLDIKKYVDNKIAELSAQLIN